MTARLDMRPCSITSLQERSLLTQLISLVDETDQNCEREYLVEAVISQRVSMTPAIAADVIAVVSVLWC